MAASKVKAQVAAAVAAVLFVVVEGPKIPIIGGLFGHGGSSSQQSAADTPTSWNGRVEIDVNGSNRQVLTMTVIRNEPLSVSATLDAQTLTPAGWVTKADPHGNATRISRIEINDPAAPQGTPSLWSVTCTTAIEVGTTRTQGEVTCGSHASQVPLPKGIDLELDVFAHDAPTTVPANREMGNLTTLVL